MLVIAVVDMSATVGVRPVDRDAVSGYDENDVLPGGPRRGSGRREWCRRGNEEGIGQGARLCVAR